MCDAASLLGRSPAPTFVSVSDVLRRFGTRRSGRSPTGYCPPPPGANTWRIADPRLVRSHRPRDPTTWARSAPRTDGQLGNTGSTSDGVDRAPEVRVRRWRTAWAGAPRGARPNDSATDRAGPARVPAAGGPRPSDDGPAAHHLAGRPRVRRGAIAGGPRCQRHGLPHLTPRLSCERSITIAA